MKNIKKLVFLLVMVSISFTLAKYLYAQGIHFGVPSAVKQKVKDLKERKDELKKPTQETSIGTIGLLEDSLKNKDITAIEPLFTEEAWQYYGSAIEDITESLPEFAEEIINAKIIDENDEIAIYTIERNEDSKILTYYIILHKINGEWKIDSL